MPYLGKARVYDLFSRPHLTTNMSATPIRVDLSVTPYLNLPLWNNQVPPLRQLTLENENENPLSGLSVTVECSPPAFTPFTQGNIEIDALGRREIVINNLQLDYELLSRLVEGAPATVKATVTDLNGKELSKAEQPVRLLPPSHWGGMLAVPEMLAAHVFPNDPAVAKLLRKASELLSQRKDGDILDGYQSGSARKAGTQAIAIYTAILREEIHYVNPPSSFESQGQKVRTPSAILSEGLGTCLDLVALGAAVLEQAGLHPMMVVIKGHAYLACWLQESPLSTGIIEDAQVLRKALRNGLLLPCETTLLVGQDGDVKAAIASGRKRTEDSEDFLFAVDLAAARNGEQIRPFALADTAVLAKREPSSKVINGLDLSVLDTLSDDPLTDEPDQEVLIGSQRIDQWKGKLLDLSRRNKLLNWKPAGGSMHLAHVDGAVLEDFLAAGKRLNFEAIDGQRAGKGLTARQLAEGHYVPAINQGLKQGKLLVQVSEAELSKNLIKLERSSRLSLEEGGANTLFVAIGFVVKPQPGQQSQFRPLARGKERAEYTAPLILIPVDLQRKRAGNAFSLRARDEDAVLNPTLLELLKKETGTEFPGLNEELPTDDSGLDIPGICRRVRQRLLNVSGWELVDGVALGEFFFAKYLMWRDLDAFEEHLRENPIVRHLIDSPREAYRYGEEGTSQVFPRQEMLDETFPVQEMLTPMSADSSQLVAVRAASQGMDFVLEGPPGTGKSQTITNIIAQCLGEGKTVLFVSEKTAALEVVHRRLKSIGLEEASLELHSNKISKTYLYDQLRSAVRGGDQLVGESDFDNEAAQLSALRRQLNGQVEALHQPRNGGISLYEAVAYVAPRADTQVPLPPSVSHLTKELIAEQNQIVRKLSVLLQDTDPSARKALQALTGPVDAEALRSACTRVVESVGTFLLLADQWASQVTGAAGRDAECYAGLADLAQVLLLARGNDFSEHAFLIESATARQEERQVLESMGEIVSHFDGLSGTYREEVMDLDLVMLNKEWQESERSWLLPRLIKQWKIKKRLGEATTSLEPHVQKDLPLLAKIHKLRATLPANRRESFRLDSTTIDRFRSEREWIGQLIQFGYSNVSERVGVTASAMAENLAAIAEENKRGRELLEKAEQYSDAWASALVALKNWRKLLGAEIDEGSPNDGLVRTAVDVAADQLSYEREWRNYGLYALERDAARTKGLAYLVDSEQSGLEISPEAALERYQVGVYKVIANEVLKSEPKLSQFSGSQFSALIDEFRKLDAAFLQKTPKEVRRRLSATAKGAYRAEHREAMGILNQELTKKRRQLPVRQLIKKLGGLLPELKPCFMMSPLSIAQYLPPDGSIRFDVVVFDEASQIPVWDAIGAIARGKQTIVVGDSKQLPPTNFFNKQHDEEVENSDEDFQVETMESILDEMKAAQVHNWRLRWHYRSRAESLIAFSNRTYYDSDLNTFPAPLQEDRAVGWHKVNSRSYINSKNVVEAKALVDYLGKRLVDTKPGDMTFGVVTFNQAQQVLIQDMLESLRTENSEVERHFNSKLEEPVFVKNIESVQGDERDIILFSITYGPNEAGKVYQRFGPMNATGGERRLNVAVTRARQEMHVFSSIEPENINLKSLGQNAQGARDLRLFLSFAKLGTRAFAEQIQSIGGEGDYDSPFERAVAEKLRANGFETDPQVGVSGYRIDLGVRDPQRPGCYLAGVECDGASYHSTATARERDILRQSVLEGLGWNILRIWSLDWWYDPDRTMEKLLNKLRQLSETPPNAGTPTVGGLESVEVDTKSENDATRKNLSIDGTIYLYTTASDLGSLKQEAERNANEEEGDPFYQDVTKPITGRMIKLITDKEGPLLLEELVRRVSIDGYGYSRTGSRIRKIVEGIAAEVVSIEEVHGEQIVWSQKNSDDLSTRMILKFRHPDPIGLASRSISEIPIIELESLARVLIQQGLDGDALIREMGSKIGVKRVSGSSRQRLLNAIDYAWK